MSVNQRMLGTMLPCNVLEILGIEPLLLPAPAHDTLTAVADHAYPDVLYKLGLSHLGRQEVGLARQRLLEAIRIKPSFIRARLALAAVCDLLALHQEAIDQLDTVLAAMPASAQEAALAGKVSIPVSRYALLSAAGFCLERTSDWEGAVARYSEALQHNPPDLFADYRLSAIYLAHGELEKAVNHHRWILAQQPQEQAVRISLAHTLQALGRPQEAVWEYEKACCLEPASVELGVELVEQLALMGNTEEAIDHLRDMIARQPQFPDLRLRLANLYSDRGHDDEAVAEYRTALSLHPDYLECRIALAHHEMRMGRIEQAEQGFSQAIATNDQNVEAHVGLAVALHRLGQEQRAHESLQKAGQLASNTDMLLLQLGALELTDGRPADGESDNPAPPPADRQAHRQWLTEQAARYEAMLEEHPSWTDVRLRYAMLLKLLGQYVEAMAHLERCTAENPGYVEAWIHLGLARLDTGNGEGAMSAFAEAVRLRPQQAELHYRLGLIYCNQMEFDLAMEQLELAASVEKKNIDAHRQIWVTLQGLQMNHRQEEADMEGRVLPLASGSR